MAITLARQSSSLRTLVLATFLTMLGNGLFAACSAVYFTQIAGLSVHEFGLGFALGGAIGLLAGVPCGHLADLVGPKRVTVTLTALTAVTSLGLLTVHTFGTLVAATAVFSFMDRGAYAALQALLAGLIGDRGELVRSRALLRAVTNVGLAAGAGAGALVLQIGSRGAYQSALAGNSLSFLLSATALALLPSVPGIRREGEGDRGGRLRLAVLHDRRYAALTAVNVVMFLHFSLLDVALPLWVVRHTDAPRPAVGALLVINTVTVALLQVRIAGRTHGLADAARHFALSGIALAGACALFAAAASPTAAWAVALLLLGAVVHVYGEMVHSAAAWTASFELAPAGMQGQYQGLFNTGFFASQALGPAVLALVVANDSPVGWAMLAAAFVSAGQVLRRLIGRV